MSMRKIIKGSLISLAVLGMIGGSVNSNVANAKHRHVHYTRRIKRTQRHGKRNRLYRHHGRIRYSYRRNRHARRHYVKKYRHIRNHKHVIVHRHHTKRSRADATHKYIVGTNINQNLADMKSQTANDINNDRQENGVSPLAETNELDNIAQMRANTPSQTSEHTDPSTGNYYNEEAAYKLGYVSNPSDDDYAENLDGAWESPNSQDGASYDPHNGKEVADECNDVMMNHDQPSDNGHRQNILDSDYSQMGIGTSYNPSNKSFHVVEEFY